MGLVHHGRTSVMSLPPRPQKPLVSKSVKGQGMPSSRTILKMLWSEEQGGGSRDGSQQQHGAKACAGSAQSGRQFSPQAAPQRTLVPKALGPGLHRAPLACAPASCRWGNRREGFTVTGGLAACSWLQLVGGPPDRPPGLGEASSSVTS